MEMIHKRCAGLDVHSETVVACVRVAGEKEATHEVRTFGTTTPALLELSDWLASQGCTHVVMESTGVYWKPVWHVLVDDFELILANAQHVRNIPGRKTDVKDAEWLADLLAHGLIRGSFVPPEPIQELRDLTRTRKQLVREIAHHTRRIQKVLEDANVKLTNVLSDILGRSGRAILQALIGGEASPKKLADLVDVRVQAPKEDIRDALHGRVTEHHRFMLGLHLRHIETLDLAVERVEARLNVAMGPFRDSWKRLTTIPGVKDTVAQVIVAEVGDQMDRFADAGHLVSWAGLCPRMNESAGKRMSTRIQPGDPWLKTTLVQAAWAAARKKKTYLRAQFLRLKARRGPKKAIVAVAASMLTAAYHMLKKHVDYRELGEDYFDRQDKTKTATRLVRRLQNMGFAVAVQPAPVPVLV